MVSTTNGTPVFPGSLLSVPDLLTGLAQAALREGAHEMARATGSRGMVRLRVDLCLGDNGVPQWADSTVFFERKHHRKDVGESK